MLQELICSLLLLMNLAILWDSPTQMSVEPWCTLSTHMWTQKPSHFIGMIGEEFRNYTVNTLDFQDKAYQCIGFTTLPDCRGFLVLPKRKKGENLRGEKKNQHVSVYWIHYICSVTCPHCHQELMKRQCNSLAHCLPAHLCIARHMSYGPYFVNELFQQVGILAEYSISPWENDTIPLTKSMGQTSESRNYSEVIVEHSWNRSHRINFAMVYSLYAPFSSGHSRGTLEIKHNCLCCLFPT